EGFTRFIRLHRGHSPHKIPVQRPAPRERNSPATAGPDVVRPHAITAMTTTQPGQSTGTTATYGYDNAGNMTTRPGRHQRPSPHLGR
ncbi:hypothetical protein, partial [Actinoplanes sp. NPDC026619]|uniref:hypothetical protein n=1 Tax=Actinoplanes sp. NPDC026619 TaxID=3155798 RepID=UPI0033E9C02E